MVVKTLKKYFKNVYVIPCNNKDDKNVVQNNMVIATDENINYNDYAVINCDDAIVLTDNYCPVDTIIPKY